MKDVKLAFQVAPPSNSRRRFSGNASFAGSKLIHLGEFLDETLLLCSRPCDNPSEVIDLVLGADNNPFSISKLLLPAGTEDGRLENKSEVVLKLIPSEESASSEASFASAANSQTSDRETQRPQVGLARSQRTFALAQ
jgi:hypothetical protein